MVQGTGERRFLTKITFTTRIEPWISTAQELFGYLLQEVFSPILQQSILGLLLHNFAHPLVPDLVWSAYINLVIPFSPHQETRKNTYLQMSRQLNLNIRAKRELMHGNTSPARLWLLWEKGIVDFIHSSEVLHVGEKDVDFNDVVDTASCCFEHFGEVGQGLFLQLR